MVRWREDQRIMRAKLLLQTTPLSVATIGQQVGYDDQLYFSRVFRKRVGVSPPNTASAPPAVSRARDDKALMTRAFVIHEGGCAISPDEP